MKLFKKGFSDESVVAIVVAAILLVVCIAVVGAAFKSGLVFWEGVGLVCFFLGLAWGVLLVLRQAYAAAWKIVSFLALLLIGVALALSF